MILGRYLKWYAMVTGKGREEQMQRACERQFNNKALLSACFIPLKQEIFHAAGEWHVQTKKLLPGYLFLASDDPTQLTEQCKKNHMLAKNDELILLNDQDMGLFSLTKNGIFELSKGIIVNGKLKIISGPLMGKKSEIKKNDHHKRKAWVSVNLFGKEQLIVVGLEVFQKIETVHKKTTVTHKASIPAKNGQKKRIERTAQARKVTC